MKELEGKLQVTYVTAWRMAKVIRETLESGEGRGRHRSFEEIIAACVRNAV